MEETRSDIRQALMGTEFPTPARKSTATADCEQMAKRGCFVENMIQTAVPLKSSITLNGSEIIVDLNE